MTDPIDRRYVLAGVAASLGMAATPVLSASSDRAPGLAGAPAVLPALGDALDTLPRSLRSFDPAIVGDGRTDVTTRIATALASGARHILVPGDGEAFVIDGSISLPTGYGVTLEGQGAAILLQKSLHQRTLDGIGVRDCCIRNLKFTADYVRAYPGDRGFRGDNFYSASSAIWLNGSNNRVADVEVDGLVTAVWLGSWNGRENRADSVGNAVERLSVGNVDFGVLLKGQIDAVVKHIRARNVTLSRGSPNPQHTIYATGTEHFRSSNMTVADIRTDACPGSAAVQIKFVDGLAASDLISDQAGALNLISVRGFAVSSIVARRASDQGGPGAVAIAAQNSDGATRSMDGVIDNVSLEMDASAGRAVTAFGDRIHARKISVRMNRPMRVSGTDVSLAGRDSSWDLELFNDGEGAGIGVDVRTAPGVETDGMDVHLRRANGANTAMRTSAGATHTRFHYDPVAITVTPRAQRLIDAGSGTVIEREDTELSYGPITGGGAMSLPDYSVTAGTRARIRIGDGLNYVVPNPGGTSSVNVPPGTTFDLTIQNVSAGRPGNITFGPRYVFTAGFRAPGPGRSVTHRFRFDGVNLVEQ
jgi:hypothetical protein